MFLALSRAPFFWKSSVLFGFPEDTTSRPGFPPIEIPGLPSCLSAQCSLHPHEVRTQRVRGAKIRPCPSHAIRGLRARPPTRPGRCASHAITFLFAYQVTGPGRAPSPAKTHPSALALLLAGSVRLSLRSALMAELRILPSPLRVGQNAHRTACALRYRKNFEHNRNLDSHFWGSPSFQPPKLRIPVMFNIFSLRSAYGRYLLIPPLRPHKGGTVGSSPCACGFPPAWGWRVSPCVGRRRVLGLVVLGRFASFVRRLRNAPLGLLLVASPGRFMPRWPRGLRPFHNRGRLPQHHRSPASPS